MRRQHIDVLRVDVFVTRKSALRESMVMSKMFVLSSHLVHEKMEMRQMTTEHTLPAVQKDLDISMLSQFRIMVHDQAVGP